LDSSLGRTQRGEECKKTIQHRTEENVFSTIDSRPGVGDICPEENFYREKKSKRKKQGAEFKTADLRALSGDLETVVGEGGERPASQAALWDRGEGRVSSWVLRAFPINVMVNFNKGEGRGCERVDGSNVALKQRRKLDNDRRAQHQFCEQLGDVMLW